MPRSEETRGGGPARVSRSIYSRTTATPALLSLTGHHGDFPELLLEALDELLERQRQTLGGHVADHDAVGHLEQHLLLAALRVGVGHVEAEIDDGLLLGGVDP